MISNDPYMKYNIRAVHQRTIDTLIGISKGMIADGVVNQKEAEGLLSWLSVNEKSVAANPVTAPLSERLGQMLFDKVLDRDEADELLELLTSLSGGISEFGEEHRSATLPLDRPLPSVIFEDRTFLFTGVCIYGNRKKCETAVIERAGRIAPGVRLNLNYLVIGNYVTSSWKHQSFGDKIVEAMRYRDSGKSTLAIISEDHWMKEAGLKP